MFYKLTSEVIYYHSLSSDTFKATQKFIPGNCHIGSLWPSSMVEGKEGRVREGRGREGKRP